MASPVLKRRREVVDQRSSNESAALRLIAAERPEEILPILLEEIVFLGFPRAAVVEVDFDTAERPEEILPILLEEIVFLGFPRAAVVEVDFDTGEIKPAASLNLDSSQLERFRTSLWASEDPLVDALLNVKPALLPDGKV